MAAGPPDTVVAATRPRVEVADDENNNNNINVNSDGDGVYSAEDAKYAFDRLKEKFNNATSFAEKVKIVSLDPSFESVFIPVSSSELECTDYTLHPFQSKIRTLPKRKKLSVSQFHFLSLNYCRDLLVRTQCRVSLSSHAPRHTREQTGEGLVGTMHRTSGHFSRQGLLTPTKRARIQMCPTTL